MKKNKKTTLKWIVINSKGVAFAIIFLTLIGVAVAFVSTRFAIAAMNLLDSVTGKSTLNFSDCIYSLVILLLIQLLLQVVYTLYDIKVRAKYKNFLQKNLFDTVITRDYLSISKIHSGELINRLTSDISTINSNIIDIVPGTVTLISGIAFSFFTMLRLDYQLSLICLALGPIVMISSVVYGTKMKSIYKQCQLSDGKTRSFMQECIQNILAVKAFCSEKKSLKVAESFQNINYKFNMKRGYISVIVNIMYYLTLTAAYYFAVAWCAYKIKIGIMTVGTFTAIIQLVGNIQSPFRDLSSIIPKYYATCASAERIMEIENISADSYGTNKNVNYDADNFNSIETHQLSFSYDKENILQDADISINRGDIAVIKGLSGIGKSTFFKLLLGVLKPDDGSIVLNCGDKKVPVDYNTRHLFTYVPQGNMILSGSIRKNITFFDDESDDSKIINAAKNACIWDCISSLPNGLDTEIGENGIGLSEGQIQRIAIARAFYYDSPIILLDEATSALDEETELAVLNNIKKMESKTCIIITHKERAIEICNKCILFRERKIQNLII